MGRRKNNNNNNNSQSSMNITNTITRFQDEEDDTTVSSNLEDSVTAIDKTTEDEAMCDADVSYTDADDDKTSADYYFDSYSHFGMFLFYFLRTP